jgi:hypothetical protein
MTDVQIKFNAPATLRKWPSINKQRLADTAYPEAYLVLEGTLHECIREMMSKHASSHHSYEIHTVPPQPLVSAVLSAENVVELPQQTFRRDVSVFNVSKELRFNPGGLGLFHGQSRDQPVPTLPLARSPRRSTSARCPTRQEVSGTQRRLFVFRSASGWLKRTHKSRGIAL